MAGFIVPLFPQSWIFTCRLLPLLSLIMGVIVNVPSADDEKTVRVPKTRENR